MRFEVLEKYFTLRSNGSIYMLNLLSKSSSRVSSGISGISGTLGEMPALLMYSTTWESWTQFCRLLMPSDKFLSVQWHGLSETQHIEIARKSRINIGRHRSALSGSNNFLAEIKSKIYQEKKDGTRKLTTCLGISWRTALARLNRALGASSSCWKSAGSRLPQGRYVFRSANIVRDEIYIFNKLFGTMW